MITLIKLIMSTLHLILLETPSSLLLIIADITHCGNNLPSSEYLLSMIPVDINVRIT